MIIFELIITFIIVSIYGLMIHAMWSEIQLNKPDWRNKIITRKQSNTLNQLRNKEIYTNNHNHSHF